MLETHGEANGAFNVANTCPVPDPDDWPACDTRSHEPGRFRDIFSQARFHISSPSALPHRHFHSVPMPCVSHSAYASGDVQPSHQARYPPDVCPMLNNPLIRGAILTPLMLFHFHVPGTCHSGPLILRPPCASVIASRQNTTPSLQPL
jgi:hypothetical protein